MNNFSIGFYDSGIGGLNVLKYIYNNTNFTSYVYLGDNVNAPYGNKSIEELKKLSYSAIVKLLNNNVNYIVISCNTISTTLYNFLTNEFGNIFIPTLPTLSKSGILLCTYNTSKSEYVKKNFNKDNVLPLYSLAKDIEDNIFNLDNINLSNYFNVLNVDEIVLGCTHYIFLEDRIKIFAKAKIVKNGLEEVLLYLNKLINYNFVNIKNDNFCKKQVKFIGEFAKYNNKIYKNMQKN